MKRTFIATSILLCLFTGCISKTETVKTNNADIVIPLEHDYNEVKDFDLTWDCIFEVERNEYYVYIYSTSCSHCIEIKNLMIETALQRKDIYFIKGSSKDNIANDSDLPKNAENPGEIWILGYPTLLKIVNKTCVKNLAGKSEILDELK